MCDICAYELSEEEKADLPLLTRVLHGLPIGEQRRVPWMDVRDEAE